ncbi:hypothetical protein BGZ63DRAFT_53432 [Mariannaea sp. PMI_226]|nr:hypothetical protein BGZ63DRAFT_53432 [Mariannaea sp. PMI_226]
MYVSLNLGGKPVSRERAGHGFERKHLVQISLVSHLFHDLAPPTFSSASVPFCFSLKVRFSFAPLKSIKCGDQVFFGISHILTLVELSPAQYPNKPTSTQQQWLALPTLSRFTTRPRLLPATTANPVPVPISHPLAALLLVHCHPASMSSVILKLPTTAAPSMSPAMSPSSTTTRSPLTPTNPPPAIAPVAKTVELHMRRH